MKQLIRFLVRNTAWWLLLYCLGWAVWAWMNWESLSLVQRLLMGMFGLLSAHEIEETYKDRFIMMMSKVIGFRPEELPMQGIIHLPADTVIALLMSLAILHSDKMWLVLPVFVLGIIEMVVHNTAIVAFRLKGLSPGWYSAMVMGVYSIYSLVLICQSVAFDKIQWLWTVLLLVAGFGLLEVWIFAVCGKFKVTKWQTE